MTTPSKTTDPREWQTLYSAEEARWKDLPRIGRVLVPVLLLIFLAVMAAVLYAGLHSPAWLEQVHTRLGGYWVIFRIYVTFLAPLLAALGGIVLLYRAMLNFVRSFYNRYEEKRLLSLVQRRVLGVPPLPPPLGSLWKYPFVTIREPKDLPEDHWVRWLGGPATLVVYDGVALYLERGNCFSRVVGPGKPPMPFLDRHETIRAAVDLRPQVKSGEMKPWTKDGIQVELSIRMECQINASQAARQASRNLVYPFDPLAVKQAVEYTAVKYDEKTRGLYESDWLDGVWGQVTGYLGRYVSGHSIDEISLAGKENVGLNGERLHVVGLVRKFTEEINANLEERPCGAHLNSLQVWVKFPEDVDNQRTAYWESERGKLAAIRDSKAEADGIRVRQEARARAKRDMLNTITERLKRVGAKNLTEPLLLSLIGVLDNSLDDPVVRSLVAKDSLMMLEKLRQLLRDRF